MSERFATYQEYQDYINRVDQELYSDDAGNFQQAWLEKDVDVVEAFAEAYIRCRINVDDITNESKLYVFQITRGLLLNEAYGREEFTNIPESIAERYEWAKAELEKIRSGEFCLTVNTPPDPEEGFSFPYSQGCTPVYDCEDNNDFV